MICTYRTHFHTKTCFERDTRIHSSMSCSQEPLILIKISNLLPHIQNSDKNDMHTAMLLFMALSMPFSYTIIIIGGFRFSLIKRLNSQISILSPIQFIPTKGAINSKRTPPQAFVGHFLTSPSPWWGFCQRKKNYSVFRTLKVEYDSTPTCANICTIVSTCQWEMIEVAVSAFKAVLHGTTRKGVQFFAQVSPCNTGFKKRFELLQIL